MNVRRSITHEEDEHQARSYEPTLFRLKFPAEVSGYVTCKRSSGSTIRTRFKHGLLELPIAGTGFVGSTTAYALLLSKTPAEIVLINRDRRRADGHVQDLCDAAVFSHTTRVIAGQFDDCCWADVIIFAVGLSQSGQGSRLDSLNDTAAILKDLVRNVVRHNPHGILLIASNPVDLLTYAAWKWSGLPPSRVIGSGTALDTSRFRRRLAEHYGVASDNVHAYVIGEHGESQVVVISSARIAGMPLGGFCREQDLPCDRDALRKIVNDTRISGLEIIRAKGATYYGIGTVLARIAVAILRDEHAILTVSNLCPSRSTDLYRRAIKGKGVKKLTLPQQSTICFRQLCFIADIGPIGSNDLNLM
jgi:L-lactate dehydrogenase